MNVSVASTVPSSPPPPSPGPCDLLDDLVQAAAHHEPAVSADTVAAEFSIDDILAQGIALVIPDVVGTIFQPAANPLPESAPAPVPPGTVGDDSHLAGARSPKLVEQEHPQLGGLHGGAAVHHGVAVQHVRPVCDVQGGVSDVGRLAQQSSQAAHSMKRPLTAIEDLMESIDTSDLDTSSSSELVVRLVPPAPRPSGIKQPLPPAPPAKRSRSAPRPPAPLLSLLAQLPAVQELVELRVAAPALFDGRTSWLDAARSALNGWLEDPNSFQLGHYLCALFWRACLSGLRASVVQLVGSMTLKSSVHEDPTTQQAVLWLKRYAERGAWLSWDDRGKHTFSFNARMLPHTAVGAEALAPPTQRPQCLHDYFSAGSGVVRVRGRPLVPQPLF